MNDPDSLLPPYFPTRRSARIVGVLFVVSAALSWVAVGYDFSALRLATSGHKVIPEVRLAHTKLGALIAWAQLGSLTLTGLAFLVWLHRVRVNVRALGMRRLAYARHWTVLGFLVPALNALRPYQVVREIWKASDPTSGDPLRWKAVKTPPLLAVWWGLFVAYFALELLSMFSARFAVKLSHIQLAHGLGLCADVCAAISASFAYFVVLRISEAQEAKLTAWGRGNAGTVPLDPRDAVA